MDPIDAAWQKLADIHLKHVLGDLSAERAIAAVQAAARDAAIDSDARVRKLVARLTAEGESDDRRRKRGHAARNAIAGVIATVELVESHLRGESPERPLLLVASVEERRELLEAVRRSVLAAKSLTATLDQALAEDAG